MEARQFIANFTRNLKATLEKDEAKAEADRLTRMYNCPPPNVKFASWLNDLPSPRAIAKPKPPPSPPMKTCFLMPHIWETDKDFHNYFTEEYFIKNSSELDAWSFSLTCKLFCRWTRNKRSFQNTKILVEDLERRERLTKANLTFTYHEI